MDHAAMCSQPTCVTLTAPLCSVLSPATFSFRSIFQALWVRIDDHAALRWSDTPSNMLATSWSYAHCIARAAADLNEKYKKIKHIYGTDVMLILKMIHRA
jgi:hypothetical protein